MKLLKSKNSTYFVVTEEWYSSYSVVFNLFIINRIKINVEEFKVPGDEEFI